MDLGHRFATATFPESDGGVYLCGINWGGRDDDAMATLVRRRASFFSDDSAGTYRYRERILRWFELWGAPLRRREAEDGALERAISQVNWLADRSERAHHRAQVPYLLEHFDELVSVLALHRPRVVFLFGACLGAALARAVEEEDKRATLEALFGPLEEAPETLFRQAEEGRAASLRRLRFLRAQFLCFPHPTGAFGLTNEQVSCFRPEVEEALEFWRKGAARPIRGKLKRALPPAEKVG